MPLFGSHGAWQGQERLTAEARRAVQRAEAEGAARGLHRATADVLLAALLAETGGVPVAALVVLGVDVDELRKSLGTEAPQRLGAAGRAPLDAAAREAVILGVNEARRAGFAQTGAGHLLLGLLEERSGAGPRHLSDRGVKVGAVRAVVHELEEAGDGDSAALFAAAFDRVLERVGGARSCPTCAALLHRSFRYCYQCGAAVRPDPGN